MTAWSLIVVEKFVPVIVKTVPPSMDPVRGETLVTVEEVTKDRVLALRSPYYELDLEATENV